MKTENSFQRRANVIGQWALILLVTAAMINGVRIIVLVIEALFYG